MSTRSGTEEEYRGLDEIRNLSLLLSDPSVEVLEHTEYEDVNADLYAAAEEEEEVVPEQQQMPPPPPPPMEQGAGTTTYGHGPTANGYGTDGGVLLPLLVCHHHPWR